MQWGVESFHLVENRKSHDHRLQLFAGSGALMPMMSRGRVSSSATSKGVSPAVETRVTVAGRVRVPRDPHTPWRPLVNEAA
jgi:hypothetical protein